MTANRDDQSTPPGAAESDVLHPTWQIDPQHYSYRVSASRWASFKYALAGWLYMLRYQKNTRIQAAASIGVLVLAFWLQISALKWAILILTIGLEWMAEFVNAAIEAAVNLSSAGPHPMAKVSKDVAAAAVLLGAVVAIIVGALLLGPPLLERLQELGS
ncbi:MAG: diacylglycerol kinase family protein [Anaerolineae bacterium]|nr:diacylglycerol kinase family protein [Anaerolineae bacterium]